MTIAGENGILTKARLAKKMAEVSSEREVIELIMLNSEPIFDIIFKAYLIEVVICNIFF